MEFWQINCVKNILPSKGREKYHGKIFAKFVQLDSAYTKKESSTGLGLTITKELVELHGGKISLISEVNNGSTFIVEIPL